MLDWFERWIDPYPVEKMDRPPAKFFEFLWFCSKGVRLYIAMVVALTALLGIFEAAMFSALGGMVDWLGKATPSRLFEQEGGKLALLGLVLLASPLVVALQTWIKRQAIAGSFPMRLRWNFHRWLLSQSMSFYQDEFAGRLASKVMQTALAARDVLLIVADIMVFIAIYFATMAWLLGGFHPWLLAIFGGWIALYVCELAYYVPRLAKAGQAQADARSVMNGRVTDAYSNIATVKLFSHTNREAEFAKEAMQGFMVSVRQQMRLVSGMEMVNHVLSVLLIAATAGAALWLWTQGRAGIGAVAASAAMAMRLNGISHWIMWEMASLFENIGAVQDGMETLARPISIVDGDQAEPLAAGPGEVVFEKVGFGYGTGKDILSDFDLRIKAGEKIGLVGRSGAGKSTTLSLLLRFFDAERGRVLIDGQDISKVSQDSLRSQIGMVTQDTSLLHRSVRDNIAYGRPDAREEDIVRAACMAKADAFIETLIDAKGRQGMEAHVGERGVKLSGGQRQRVAIARVMLKNAPILLLDEATSALDSEVEAAIQESLQTLMRGKTVIAIAHRLSTIAAMDRLIVMDQGRIVEQGTHEELLVSGGLYAALWSHQSGGFLGER